MSEKRMKYFYDTEFLEDGNTIDLISIGIVCEDGSEYYAVNSDADWARIVDDDWLMRNVAPTLPVLQTTVLDRFLKHPPHSHPRPSVKSVRLDTRNAIVKPKWVIANEVRDFLLRQGEPELWAWYAAYDHVALAQLFGKMINLPAGIPMYTNDLKQVVGVDGIEGLPQPTEDEHNALADARHVMRMHTFVFSRKQDLIDSLRRKHG